MRPEQIEDVIRRPAARVGVQVEPGLVAEIVRDIEAAPAYLPLLQYVLTELFEHRTEDRLTVHAYRSLGGVQGVLERRAEATFSALTAEAQVACRHLFLRMVHLGDQGEETRRRLPLTEVHGLGKPADIDVALQEFATARLLTYDRDPVTRTPTVEVAHETVISRWPRYRVWIDDVRTDLIAHGRLAAATTTWAESGEDPAYLLTGGPLLAALDLQSHQRVGINDLETRFVEQSEALERSMRERERERQRQEDILRLRASRRLTLGVASAAVAVVIAVVAGLAWMQRQRADELAATLERQNLSRELAALSRDSLTSDDPDLSLLLAIAAAEQSIDAGEEIPSEVVDALHLSVTNPRPALEFGGARLPTAGEYGKVIDLSDEGTRLAVLAAEGGVTIHETVEGATVARIPATENDAFGTELRFDGERVYTVHTDGVRVWGRGGGTDESGVPLFELEHLVSPGSPDREVTSATHLPGSPDLLALGLEGGTIEIWQVGDPPHLLRRLAGHGDDVKTLDFDPGGGRLVSGSRDQVVLVWDTEGGEVISQPNIRDNAVLPIRQVAWHPLTDEPRVAVIAARGDAFLFDAENGDRLTAYGRGLVRGRSIGFFGGLGAGLMANSAGEDGFAYLYGTNYGGQAVIALHGGGGSVADAEMTFNGSDLVIVTVAAEGTVRIWRDIYRSELPALFSGLHHPRVTATPGGERFLFGSHNLWDGTPDYVDPWLAVFDASTMEPVAQFKPLKDWELRRRPTISDDGTKVAFVGEGGHIKIANVGSDEAVSIPNGETATALAFNSEGSMLAGGFDDGRIVIWDTTTGNAMRAIVAYGS
ncbi:MAG TPA: WD40 repeat domain-containing protein, partial [Acidimicrobiia bacterium]|nr:WD40 repeat domain-containing protein [Acidimicrobiia bacterium]